MKTKDLIKTDKELLEGLPEHNGKLPNVDISYLSASQFAKHSNISIHIRSSMFILVLSGTADIEINFQKHELERRKIVLLSVGHFFKIQNISKKFKCVALYVSKNYIDEMYSTEMLYKRMKYGVKLYQTPMLKLNEQESNLLTQRFDFIKGITQNTEHRYHKEIILSSLTIFLLDLSNIIEKEAKQVNAPKKNRDEIYFLNFLELLTANYKTQHYVEFYANKIHITPHYLTLIVKRLSGQTVSDLIFHLLFSEAKLLLQQPNLSIQQIADDLHFAEQSAFGKFFKRKSGLSPKDYRTKMKM